MNSSPLLISIMSHSSRLTLRPRESPNRVAKCINIPGRGKMTNAARVFQRVAPRPSAPEPLFRPEVLAERQTQWLGTVLLAPRISHTAFACAALLTAAGILAFLVFGSYTRKAHVSGWLVSQQG